MATKIIDDGYGAQFEDAPLGRDLPISPKPHQIPRVQNAAPSTDYGLLDNVKAAFTASRFNLIFDKYTDDEVENLKSLDVTGIGERNFDKWALFNEYGYAPEQAAYYDANVNSYNDFVIYQDKYKKVASAKNVMQDSGIVGGVASFLSETIGDPMFLATLPLGAAGKGPAAIRYAISGGASAVPSEMMALAVDPTRTSDEAIVNVSSGLVLGGAIGGAIDGINKYGMRKLGTTSLNEIGQKVLDETKQKAMVDPVDIVKQPSTAGAMQVKPIDLSPGGTKIGSIAAKIFSPLSPRNRAAKYIAPESQKLNSLLAGNPTYITKATEEGLALPETIPDQIINITKSYSKTSSQIFDLQKQVQKATNKTQTEINEIYYSIVNGKMDNETIESLSKESTPYAPLYKAALVQRAKQEESFFQAQSSGVTGLEKRKLYGHQLKFNPMKASADIDNLRKKYIEKYKATKDELVQKYNKQIQNKKLGKEFLEKEKAQFVNRLDKNGRDYYQTLEAIDDEIDDIRRILASTEDDWVVWADKEITRIIYGDNQSVEYLGFGKARKYPGFFMPRDLDPIEFQPWLETDYQKLNASYGRSIAAKISFAKTLGDNTGEKALKEYSDIMNTKITQAREAGDNKLADKLAKEQKSVLSDAVNLLRQHEGTYASEFYQNNPEIASAIEGASNMISFASLGNSVLGSVAEVAAISLHHNITKVVPKYAKALKNIASDPIFREASKKDLQETARALELAENALVNNILLEGASLGDASIRGFRALETTKKYYYRLTGQVYYDYCQRLVAGLVQQSMFVDYVRKFAAGKSNKEIDLQMSIMGISKDDAKKLIPLFDQHIDNSHGIPLLNTGKWEDKELVNKVTTALIRDQRRTALSAKTGDLPIAASHPAMRLLLKFKEWPLLATQNYMIPSIQRADATAFSGAMTMVGFGSLAYMAREAAAGREIPDKPEDILYAGVEMSGVAGILPEVGLNYIANYAGINGGGAGYVGYNSLLEQFIGPTAGFVRNIDGASDLLPGGEKGTQEDLKYLWRMVPLNNHPFAKQIEKSLEE